MSQPLRIGVIGTGSLGYHHARILRDLPGIVFKGFYEANADRAGTVTRELGIRAYPSVEALLGAIVGGMGTLWGPVLGALALHALSDLTRNLFGDLPGLNMVIYGLVLVLIVTFMPRGIAGIGQSVRQRWQGGGRG